MADVYELAEQFRQRVIRRERDTAGRLVREYGRVYQRLQDEVRQLLAAAEAARQRGEIVDASWVYRYDRLRRLQAQTEAQVRRFAEAAGLQIEAGQLEGARAGQRDAAALMRAALEPLPRGAAVAATFSRLPDAALNALIGFTEDGTPLGKLLAGLGPDAARRIGDALIQGVALGKNPKVIAGDVRRALGGNLHRVLTIARTETLRAYREATRASYAANSDIISGWRWLSARQARTCPACWAMDGRVFELDEPMPAHPNCRCVMLPIIIGGRPSTAPATGAEAFAKLSAADQRKVLGADYDAWKAGRVTLESFVRVRKSPDWGTTVSAGRAAEKAVRLPGRLDNLLGPISLGAELRFGPAQQTELFNRLSRLIADERANLLAAVMTPNKLPASRHALESLAELGVKTAAERQAIFERHLQSVNLRFFVGINRRQQTHWYLLDLETGLISLYDEKQDVHFSLHKRPAEEHKKFLGNSLRWLVEISRTESGFKVLREWTP